MREEFIYFPPGKKEDLFSVDLAGISYCDGSYCIQRKHSEFFVWEYIMKGKGTVIAGGKEYQACAGDMYFLPIGSNHIYYSDAEEPWEKIWVNATGSLTNTLFREYNPGNMVVFKNAGGQEFLERVHEVGRDPNLSVPDKHERTALIFHEALQYLSKQFYKADSFLSKEAVLMKEYLDNHIDQNVSLKELCGLVYLSESQVVRIFKKNFGKTPHEYMLEIKLEQAKKLLLNSKLMIWEIAEQMHFCDEHYFSAIFKKKTGKTPMEYRKYHE